MIDEAEKFVKPVDPRESLVHKLENFSSLEDEIKLKYWLSKFNIEVDFWIIRLLKVMHFLKKEWGILLLSNDGYGRWSGTFSKEIKLREGYQLKYLTGTVQTGRLHCPDFYLQVHLICQFVVN
ncbi:hypothetical protein [Chryseobacterium indoltheticum]|uniref:hypothetical protein n=1 Tax=Chryseobacterium indoltheticum TaxID=254 RepID=UPI003F49736E